MGFKLPWFRRQMRLGAMSPTTAASSAKREMAASVTNVPPQGVFRLWTLEESETTRRSSQPSQRPQQSSRSSTQPLQRQQSGPSRSTARQLQQSSGPSSSNAQQLTGPLSSNAQQSSVPSSSISQQLPQPQQSTSQRRPTESQEKPKHSKETSRQSLKKLQKDKERQSKPKSMPVPASTDNSKEPRPLSLNNVKSTPEPKVEAPPPEYTELPPPVKQKSKSIFSSRKAKKLPAPTRSNPNAPDFTPIKTTETLNQQSKPKQNSTVEQGRRSDNISHQAINSQITLPTTAKSPEPIKVVDKTKQKVKTSSKQKNIKPSDTSPQGAVNRQVNVSAVTKRSEAVKKTKQNFKFMSIKKPSTETSQQAINGPVIQSPKPTKKADVKLKNKEKDLKKREIPVKAPAAPGASKAQQDFEETGILSFAVDDSLQIQSTASFLHGGVQDSDECDA